MITPSPTSKLQPGQARGILEAIVAETATRPGHIVLGVPDTSYQLHLLPTAAVGTAVGGRLVGTIRATARRIDAVGTGGGYVEPVAGRPRRVQGRVLSVDGGVVVVDAGVPIHCTPTDPRQAAASFEAGQLVSMDVLDGATFTPAG